MARQEIGVGTTGNDGTGDDLRTAGQKINSNFTELYQVTGALQLANGGAGIDGIAFDQRSLVFIGADSLNSNPSDANETYLGAAEPTKDNTIVLPDSSGTVAFIADVSNLESRVDSDIASLITSIGNVSGAAGSKIDSAAAIIIATDIALDSANVISLVQQNSVDSAAVITLVDAAYILSRTGTRLDSAAGEALIQAYVDSNYINTVVGGLYLDSSEAQPMIDSSLTNIDLTIAPKTDLGRNLGSASKRFNSAYLNAVEAAQVRTTGDVRISGPGKLRIDSASFEYVNYENRLNISADRLQLNGSNNVSSRFTVSSSIAKGNQLITNTHFLPAIDSALDLGDSNFRWKDLYLSGSTINLGGIKIKSVNNGTAIEVLDASDSAITLGGGLSAGQVNSRIDTILPYGELGQFVVSSVNNSNTYTTDYLVSVNDKFVDTLADLNIELGDAPSLSDIFNTWYRFSHNATLTFPANASEANAWTYNSGSNTVSSTVNSGTVTGFASTEKYDNYTLTVDLSSAGSDNDIGFVVAGFYTDPSTGYEYTLTVFRQTDGGINGLGSWGIVYNMGQADQQILITNGTANGTGGWNTAGATKIQVVKSGRYITATTSQFGSLTLDPATTLTYDLGSNAYTVLFAGRSKYGFGAWSQDNCVFANIVFTPQVPELLYHFGGTVSGGAGGDIYTYDPSTQTWSVDLTRALSDIPGRILHNNKTGRTFYNNGEAGYAIGTVRQFNDVIYQLPVTAQPDSADTGGLGLRPGMFATADGVTWDPASKSGGVPYPVFWDGVSWNALY